MNDCKWIVPLWHVDTLYSRRNASPLLRLVEGEESLSLASKSTTAINYLFSHRGQITDFWMCCLTRSPNFLLIVDKLQTFGCVASQDYRIFYSSWTNYRLLDVLPHRITEFSTHRGQITDFWMCCLTRSPNFLLVVEQCQTC
ncbi:hypothetical protein TNCV_3586281 [Trichonephila clavipes]|nr:hypothetical protein TNCV_3586281 [Trichonephila clavipes]